MTRKEEDKLMALAFEHSDSAESFELAANGIDEREAQRIAKYRSVKMDLLALKDVPEHQLSTEMLRDAILGKGLKPAPPMRKQWHFLAPVAAALLVVAALPFIFEGANLRSRSNSVPESGRKETMVATNRTSDAANNDNVSAVLHDVMNPVVPAPARQEPTSVSNVDSGKAEAKSTQEVLAMSVKRMDRGTMMYRGSDRSTAAVRDAAVINMSAAPSAPIADPDPIVLIGSERDALTGVAVATEVESLSNVLVGG